MKTGHIFCRFCLVCFLIAFAAMVRAETVMLNVWPDKQSRVYEVDEKIVFNVSLTEGEKPLSGKKIDYRLQGDGGFTQDGSLESTDGPVAIETKLTNPGFLKLIVTRKDDSGKTIRAESVVGVSPLEVKAKTPEPNDFDEFWNKKKTQLKALPMNPVLQCQKSINPGVELYDVRVDCLGRHPVYGYFAKPENAKLKSLPILLTFHGAGVRSASASRASNHAARGTISMDVNGQGVPNGREAAYYEKLEENEFKNWRLKQWRAPEKPDVNDNLFIDMYCRVIRSLQFMKSQPEWDGKIIVVEGTSMGGGQAIIAAGVDSDVTFCAAMVPALCYPLGTLEGNSDGWPGFLRDQTIETADPNSVRIAQYLDAASFAKRIKANAALSVSFLDKSCSPTSVYVAYNNITSEKQLFVAPTSDHTVPSADRESINNLLWNYIEQHRQKDCDDIAKQEPGQN